MFCIKCGSKSVEGAVFCLKCGTKLILDETPQQTLDISTPTPKPVEPISAPKPIEPAPTDEKQQIPQQDMQQDAANNTAPTGKAGGGIKSVIAILSVIGVFSLPLLGVNRLLGGLVPPIIFVIGLALGAIGMVLDKVFVKPKSKEPVKLSTKIGVVVGIFFIILLGIRMVNELSKNNGGSIQTSGGSGRITVGETHNINNPGFGSFEATIEYVEFVNRVENELLGGYLDPDENHTFMRVVFTVKNIGTMQGSFMEDWYRVVYDNNFVFRPYAKEGPIYRINTMSPAITGAISFMVPNEVAESDKSIVLNFDDEYLGYPIMTFVIRGDATTAPSAGASNSSGSGQTNVMPGVVNTDNWVTVEFEEAVISIPSEWERGDERMGSIDFSWNGIPGSVRVGIYEYTTVSNLFDGGFTEIVVNADSSQIFAFNDGHTGYILETPTRISWVRDDMAKGFQFYHDGNRTLFTNHEEIITAVARTLTTEWRVSLSQNTAPSVGAETGGNGGLMLAGVPVFSLSGFTVSDVHRVFGLPSSINDYGQHYYSFASFYFDDSDRLNSIYISQWAENSIFINGEYVMKNRQSLVELFGTPLKEGYEIDAEYFYEYYVVEFLLESDITMIFWMYTPSDEAHFMIINLY